jgi:cytochrome c553
VKAVSRILKSRRSLVITWGLLSVTLSLSALAEDDFLPEEKAYYLCAGCHGPDTGSVLYPMPHDIPSIIGQQKEYLLKQLLAYREGRRHHPNMSDVLGNYSNQNLADLAEYYENLGPKRPVHKATQAKPVPAAVTPVVAPAPQPAHHHHKKKTHASQNAAKSTPATHQ